MFIKNNQRKQENDQKALKEYLGNGMFTGGFEKIQHIPGNLEGHVLMHTIYMFRKKNWEHPYLSPVSNRRVLYKQEFKANAEW